MASGQPILEWLEHADLFLTPLDERQRWYRCHHLFRQFLRPRLEQMHSPTEIAALHLRASAWCAANGDLDEALQHAAGSRRYGGSGAGRGAASSRVDESVPMAAPGPLGPFVPARGDRRIAGSAADRGRPEGCPEQVGEVPALLDRIETLLPRNSSEPKEALWGEVEARRALYYWSGDGRAV